MQRVILLLLLLLLINFDFNFWKKKKKDTKPKEPKIPIEKHCRKCGVAQNHSHSTRAFIVRVIGKLKRNTIIMVLKSKKNYLNNQNYINIFKIIIQISKNCDSYVAFHVALEIVFCCGLFLHEKHYVWVVGGVVCRSVLLASIVWL